MFNLNSIILFSENPEELVDFYKKVLNDDVGWEGGDFKGFKVGVGFLTIGPHDKVRGKNLNPERIIFNLETEDVEREYERLVDIGVKVIAKPYSPGEDGDMMIATFEDIDGNYFQLVTPMKEDD